MTNCPFCGRSPAETTDLVFDPRVDIFDIANSCHLCGAVVAKMRLKLEKMREAEMKARENGKKKQP